MNEKKTTQAVNAMTHDNINQPKSNQDIAGEDLKALIRGEIQRIMSSTTIVLDYPIEFNNFVIHYAHNIVESQSSFINSDVNYWLIDSGATFHIGIHKSLFTTLEPLKTCQSVFYQTALHVNQNTLD